MLPVLRITCPARAAGSAWSGSNRLFQLLGVYWRPSESGDMWYNSTQLKNTIWCVAAAEEGDVASAPHDVPRARGRKRMAIWITIVDSHLNRLRVTCFRWN